MKKESLFTALCLFFFVAGVVLYLVELWTDFFPKEIYAKLTATDAALFVVSFVVAFFIKEKKSTNKIDHGSSLD